MPAISSSLTGTLHLARILLYRKLRVGGPMAKLAIFLVGFLALTLMIGVLATISPT
ncbi:hypothetical protein [Pseudomonas sp. F3-2]|jgi:hypothetical protein|uniref:hypothetical protein n=1 Tax=Pseudomonas sp. F3-2 TaxID=3141539 RepID=UPI00315DE028